MSIIHERKIEKNHFVFKWPPKKGMVKSKYKCFIYLAGKNEYFSVFKL